MSDARNLSEECKTCKYKNNFGLYDCLMEHRDEDELGESCPIPWKVLKDIEAGKYVKKNE